MTVTALRGGVRLARCAAAAVPGERVTCVLRVKPGFRRVPVKIVVGLKAADGSRAVVRQVSLGAPRRDHDTTGPPGRTDPPRSGVPPGDGLA